MTHPFARAVPRAASVVSTLAAVLVTAAVACPARADLLVTQPGTTYPIPSPADYTIYRFHESTGSYLGVWGAATGDWGSNWNALIQPTFSPAGDLYVPNAHGNAVLRFAGATGAYQGEFARNTVGDANPYKVCFMPTGDMLMPGGDGLIRYDTLTGAMVGPFASGAGFVPTYAPDGHLYAARYVLRGGGWYTTVLRFDGISGAPMGQYGPDIWGQASYLLFLPSGELLVADDPGARVVGISGPSGETVRDFVPCGAGGLVSTGAMALGPDGNLYIADYLGRQILRYDGSTGTPLGALVSAASGALMRPWGIVFTPRSPSGDATPPVITVAAPSATHYVVGTAVMVSFSVTDDGPGPVTVTPTVPNGSLIDTAAVGVRTFAVTATDAAGNTAHAAVDYSVVFGVNTLFDQSKAHKSGSTIPIKVQLVNAAGTNQSASGIVVHATGIVRVSDNASLLVEDSGNSNSDCNFRYDASLGGAGGYIFNLSLKGFATGTYRLEARPKSMSTFLCV